MPNLCQEVVRLLPVRQLYYNVAKAWPLVFGNLPKALEQFT